MSEKELHLGFPGADRKLKTEVPDGAPDPWDLDTKFSVVGESHPRLDAVQKVTGRAKYTYDIRFPGLIYAKMLRSPYASAKVLKVDTSKAEALPGVLHTETFKQQIRYAGQAVAGVAAQSEEILDDALALIDVEYEVLDCVVTVDDARKTDAPQVLTNGPNEAKGRPRGSLKRVQEAHGEADALVQAEYRTQVQTHSCLETHGVVCKWDGDDLTVWSSTQGTFSVRGAMARSLRIKENSVTVITEHMGGGFGSKFGVSGWDAFCARAARKTNRPCRYMLDRREEHLIAGNRPDSIQQCRFSAKKDGTLMGAEVRAWGTAGVGRGAGVANPAIYAFRATFSDQRDVRTNAGSARAFRAPRHPQGIFALEGMMDELAEKLGIDPLEFRKKNDPHPVRQAEYDIGAKAIGWGRRKKSGAGDGRIRRGLGMAATRWAHNGRPGCIVNCRIGKDGSVLLVNGAQDLGTGTRTVIGIVGAEELALPLSAVEVRLGHTTDPYGHGSGGSVTTPSMAPAVRLAAWNAKRQLLDHVAQAVGGDAGKMDLKDGKVVGAPRPLTFQQACGLMPVAAIEATGNAEAKYFGLARYTGEVAGVQFAEVEVDTETGAVKVVKLVAVQDCGQVVNELAAKSQIMGGVIQGISYALFEDRLLDKATGNMLNANLLDYKIAGVMEMPEIVTIPFSVAQGQTIAGASSLGEPPTVPTAGAIGNAVANALGVRVRSLPITPDKVLAALGAV